MMIAPTLKFFSLWSLSCLFFFFFKQKTAYEITYGDWSSDVCSSDLGLRHLRHPAAHAVRLGGQGADRVLLLLSGHPDARLAGYMVAGALAVGPRFHGTTRESHPRRLARRGYAALHADGVRHRLGAGRHLRRALRAAGAVHRADRIQPQPVAQLAADGDGRRVGLLPRSIPRRGGVGVAAGVGALRQRRALPHHVCDRGDGPDGVLSVGPARARPSGSQKMNPVLEVRNLAKAFGGIRAVNGV